MLLKRRGLTLLLLLTVAAYIGLVGAGFVWDDGGLVVRNRLTPDLANISRFFAMDLWDGAPVEQGVSGYYRPLVLVSFAVDRALFGLWAPGHHLHSLAWHLLAVALLHRLLRQLLPWDQALAGAAIFALHPAQSEAVAWISARNDPMAAALGFGALLTVLPRDAGRARLVGGGLLAWAALMSKESVVLLPLLLLLLDLVRGGPALARCYLSLLGGIGVGIGMRVAAGVDAAAWPDAVGWQLMARQAARVAGVYGASLSVAWPLCGVRSLEWLGREPGWRTAVGLGFLLLLVLAPLLLGPQRRRQALVGLAWLALAVLPTLVPVADKGVIGDRYVYLGMVGLGLWGTAVLGRAALPVVGVLIVPWLWMLHLRLPQWANDRSLWEAAVQDIGTPYTLAGLGHIRFIDGHPELALPLFVRALDADPPALDACDAVGDAAVALKQVREAEILGRWALSRGCPRTGALLGGLAAVQAYEGQWEQAAATLDGAPPDPRHRDRVVRAALALRAGDVAGYEALAADSRDRDDFAAQVQSLVGRAPQGPSAGMSGGAGGE